MLTGMKSDASGWNVLLARSNGMYCDSAMARATTSLPLPDGPVTSVDTSRIRPWSARW
jgi:hypothetical protein